MNQVKQEENEDEKEESESNSSNEFKELQAKCEDPKGTTYRLRDRRAAPVSSTAATAGSTRSISPEADDERVESQNKRLAEAEAKAKAKEAERKANLEIQARTIAAPTPSEGDDITGDEADGREDTEAVVAEPFADSQRQFIRNPRDRQVPVQHPIF